MGLVQTADRNRKWIHMLLLYHPLVWMGFLSFLCLSEVFPCHRWQHARRVVVGCGGQRSIGSRGLCFLYTDRRISALHTEMACSPTHRHASSVRTCKDSEGALYLFYFIFSEWNEMSLINMAVIAHSNGTS